VHGEVCRCGCDRLYCDPHFSSHADEEHDKDPSDCFPGLAALISPPAFAATVDALAAGTAVDAADAVNRFLNSVAPGHDALLRVVDALPEDAFSLDATTWRPARATRVLLNPEFLTEGTLERVAVLTARSMGLAWSGLSGAVESHMLRRYQQWPLDTLAHFSRWAREGDRPPSATALSAWIGREGRLWREVGEATDAARQVYSALSNVEVPHGAAAIADWLVEAVSLGTAHPA
jgi:hypothetical protein